MIKRITAAVAAVFFVAALAVAAPPAAVKGTVASVDGNVVEVTLTGEKADWVKKGAGVKFKDGAVGRITALTATTITFKSKKASELKVGEEVSLDKGPAAMSGC